MVRAATEAHARAMDQLAADLAAPNPMFTALRELPEERRGMFGDRGISTISVTERLSESTTHTREYFLAHTRDGGVAVDLAPFNHTIPTPEEFMAWAHRASGIPRADEEPITYAVVGGPPDNWHQFAVIDEETGERVESVQEVNTEEGWLMRWQRDESGALVLGEGGTPDVERVEGRFRIERAVHVGGVPAHDRDERLYRRMHLVAKVLNLDLTSFVDAAARLVMNMPEVFLMSHLSVCEGTEYDGYATFTWQTIDAPVVLVMDDDEVPTLHTPHGMKDVNSDTMWLELAEALGMTLGDADLPHAPTRRPAPTGQRALDLA